eukprot:PhF_6_TR13235/c4_g2_i3/m.20964
MIVFVCFLLSLQMTDTYRLLPDFSTLLLPPSPSNDPSQSVFLLRHLGLTRVSFFIKADGFFFPQDQLNFWGVRTRILEQYVRNSDGIVINTPNVSCAYIDVVTTTPSFLEKFYHDPPSDEFPHQFFIRKQRGKDVNLDLFYELMMNVSLFIQINDTMEPRCKDVVGFNVSWSIEYINSVFSKQYGYYVETSDEDMTYTQYLMDTQTKTKFVMGPFTFPAHNDIFDGISYPCSSQTLPYGWLCGRGLGNGTWIWECGPEEGKPFTGNNWAPGEPKLLDGCLYVEGRVCPGVGEWFSKPCDSRQFGIQMLDWRVATDVVYGYTHVLVNRTPPAKEVMNTTREQKQNKTIAATTPSTTIVSNILNAGGSLLLVSPDLVMTAQMVQLSICKRTIFGGGSGGTPPTQSVINHLFPSQNEAAGLALVCIVGATIVLLHFIVLMVSMLIKIWNGKIPKGIWLQTVQRLKFPGLSLR